MLGEHTESHPAVLNVREIEHAFYHGHTLPGSEAGDGGILARDIAEHAYKRDGKSENLIRKIIKSQFDYSKLKKDGHTIFVENNGNVEDLFEKAKAVANETNI